VASPPSSITFVAPTEMSKLEPSPPMIRFTTVSRGFRLFVIVQVFSSPAPSVPEQSALVEVSQTAESTASPLPSVSVTL
jgi:hypothetical protein